ncbi:MAG TPA: hypothetical protein GX497_02380 [Bacillus bacterium]|nr:hypothetical protein [Bacillus sp. (in: firmicutes)]
MKKLLAAIITATLIFTPLGTVIFQDQPTTVDAKKYSSGKKGFNLNKNQPNNNNNNSYFQNKKPDSPKTNKSAATPNQTNKGGLMKGLMLGGLAGLLFGSLFANMGFLGSILGLLINVLAIVVLIAVIRGIFNYFKNKKKKEDINPWRG